MKKIITAISIMCLTLFVASVGFAASKQTFTIANDAMEDSVTTLMSRKLGEELQKRSGGSFKAEVYVNAQLGSDPELAQSVQAGDIAFVVGTTAPFVNFVPKLAVFDMPMLFANKQIARAAMDKMESAVAPHYEAAGYKIMGYGDQAFRVMSTNKPVNKFADFKGQKIRTMANPNHIAMWRALGANPAPLPMSEVYIALQQGAIDAQENPYEQIVAAKLYEQQKYMVNTNHIFHAIHIVMSKKIFDKLPPEDQKIVVAAARAAANFGRDQADKRNQNRLDTLAKNKVTILDVSPEMRKEMLQKVEPVRKQISDTVGADLAKKMLDAVKEAEAKK